MKTKNICKFIDSTNDERIMTKRFIFETEEAKVENDFFAEYDRILLVTDGMGTFESGFCTQNVQNGNMIFVFAGQRYSIKNCHELNYMYIDFYGNRAFELYSRFGINEKNCVFLCGKGLVPIWKESLLRATEENIDLISESMVLYAFSLMNKQEQSTDDTATRVMNYIAENYSNKDLSVSTVAAELGYNAKYLSHLMTSKLKINFSEYIKELRLRQAVLLISQGLTSVKNISILCGFSDPLYFSKVFKGKFGVSPKEYISENGDKK